MIWTTIRLYTPLTDMDVETLHAGDRILLNGDIITARDEAHNRLIKSIDEGAPLPVDLDGAIIYYVGPTPTPPGKIIGSAGPTTSKRMDGFAIRLLEHCKIKGMIGKGERSQELRDACRTFKSIYFSSTGGVGALLSKHIIKSEIIAYEDLGTEAIHRFTVKDFPVIVINDIFGRDYYEIGRRQYHPERADVTNETARELNTFKRL